MTAASACSSTHGGTATANFSESRRTGCPPRRRRADGRGCRGGRLPRSSDAPAGHPARPTGSADVGENVVATARSASGLSLRQAHYEQRWQAWASFATARRCPGLRCPQRAPPAYPRTARYATDTVVRPRHVAQTLTITPSLSQQRRRCIVRVSSRPLRQAATWRRIARPAGTDRGTRSQPVPQYHASSGKREIYARPQDDVPDAPQPRLDLAVTIHSRYRLRRRQPAAIRHRHHRIAPAARCRRSAAQRPVLMACIARRRSSASAPDPAGRDAITCRPVPAARPPYLPGTTRVVIRTADYCRRNCAARNTSSAATPPRREISVLVEHQLSSATSIPVAA